MLNGGVWFSKVTQRPFSKSMWQSALSRWEMEMSVGVESDTKHVLCNLRLEQPLVGSWANGWGFPTTFNSPAAISKSIDGSRRGGLEWCEISTVRVNMTGCTGANDDGRWGGGSMCAVCLNLRVVRRLKWVAITLSILREVDHVSCEAFFKLN